MKNKEDRDLLPEYQACMQYFFHSANWVWVAGSLFIGAAMTALVLLVTRKEGLARWEWLGFTAFAVLILLLLKLYFNAEERRQTIVYWRMREIERRLGMYTIRVVDALSDDWGRWNRVLRWPWLPCHGRPPKDGVKDKEREKDNREIVGNLDELLGGNPGRRLPFGWLFLHSVTWLVILAWLAALILEGWPN